MEIGIDRDESHYHESGRRRHLDRPGGVGRCGHREDPRSWAADARESVCRHGVRVCRRGRGTSVSCHRSFQRESCHRRFVHRKGVLRGNVLHESDLRASDDRVDDLRRNDHHRTGHRENVRPKNNLHRGSEPGANNPHTKVLRENCLHMNDPRHSVLRRNASVRYRGGRGDNGLENAHTPDKSGCEGVANAYVDAHENEHEDLLVQKDEETCCALCSCLWLSC